MNQLVNKIDESIVKVYEDGSLVPTVYEGSYVIEDDTSFRYFIFSGSTIVDKIPYVNTQYTIEYSADEA